MPTRTIEVDAEVYAHLEQSAIPFLDKTPNDVLRRLLLGAEPAEAGKHGRLFPLIAAGTLEAGDTLVHEQPRKRRTFTATVTADGYVQLADGRRFAEPSPALKECVGSQINGWDHWIVQRVGKSLNELKV